MGDSPTNDAGPPEIVALGTIPPPVTGMTLLTEQVVRGLQQGGKITFFNWSTGISRRGLKFRAARVLRILQSLAWLLWHGRVTRARLYLVANSKGGLYLTLALVWIARRLGYEIYLHHHTYYYIERFDRRMAWIDRTMAARGVHVVHTPQMADDFWAVYRTVCPFAFIYPSIVSAPLGKPRNPPATPFQLGHLSNLSRAKGLDLVLATLRILRTKNVPARLALAGPYHTGDARDTVQRALAEFGELVEYRGPLYGDDKTTFLDGVDCFLFPSRSESWGIVLHEAMASGVPVIAYDRGCTKTVVGDGGLVVDAQADFPLAAARQIEQWMQEPARYIQASQAAVEHAARLEAEGRRTLGDFVEHLFHGARHDLYRPAVAGPLGERV
jgi:glycosyltransferase involved in cell wall biosynthesis